MTIRSAVLSILTCTSLIAMLTCAACGPADDGKQPNPPTGGGGTKCQEDAKLCPDGTSVSRSGPKCEFAECPSGPTKPPTPPG